MTRAKSSGTQHSSNSSHREMLLEHLFAGALMKHLWLEGLTHIELLNPQVDNSGYDLVLEAKSFTRHVQLKSTFRGSTVRKFNVHTRLALKPSGCVVVTVFDPLTMDLGPFHFFGGRPGKPLPKLDDFKVARHAKGNSKGVKAERPNIRVVPLSAFDPVVGIPNLAARLFGV